MSEAATAEKPASRRKSKPANKTGAGVNSARGEAVLVVPGHNGGKERRFKLAATMAAQAAIEDAFEIDSLVYLESALETAGTKQLAIVLAELINGGEGREAVTADECRRFPITTVDFVGAVAAAFSAAGAVTAEETPAGK